MPYGIYSGFVSAYESSCYPWVIASCVFDCCLQDCIQSPSLLYQTPVKKRENKINEKTEMLQIILLSSITLNIYVTHKRKKKKKKHCMDFCTFCHLKLFGLDSWFWFHSFLLLVELCFRWESKIITIVQFYLRLFTGLYKLCL